MYTMCPPGCYHNGFNLVPMSIVSMLDSFKFSRETCISK